jgi:hypothetical protein
MKSTSAFSRQKSACFLFSLQARLHCLPKKVQNFQLQTLNFSNVSDRTHKNSNERYRAQRSLRFLIKTLHRASFIEIGLQMSMIVIDFFYAVKLKNTSA